MDVIKKKYNLIKMGVNIYYLELTSILLNIFQQQKLIKKGHTDREHIFEEKKTKSITKKTWLKIYQN